MDQDTQNYIQEVKIALKKSHDYDSRLGLGLIILIAVATSFTMVIHSDRVIARKASLVTCSAFSTQEIAQRVYDEARLSEDPTQYRIYKGLDRDNNGIACQDLPR